MVRLIPKGRRIWESNKNRFSDDWEMDFRFEIERIRPGACQAHCQFVAKAQSGPRHESLLGGSTPALPLFFPQFLIEDKTLAGQCDSSDWTIHAPGPQSSVRSQ